MLQNIQTFLDMVIVTFQFMETFQAEKRLLHELKHPWGGVLEKNPRVGFFH